MATKINDPFYLTALQLRRAAICERYKHRPIMRGIALKLLVEVKLP